MATVWAGYFIVNPLFLRMAQEANHSLAPLFAPTCTALKSNMMQDNVADF